MICADKPLLAAHAEMGEDQPEVATEALRRPADFIQAAKQHCRPELNF